MTRSPAVLVWCPFPDRESALEAANLLLDENLIACANMLGEMVSVFDYDGRRSSEREIAVLFKTFGPVAERMVSRLGEIHPYDTPAITGWECGLMHSLTAEWLGSLLGEARPGSED